MHVEHHLDINATPERVYSIISDVEQWPEITESVTPVQLLTPGPLAVGSEARLSQPKFGTRAWRVTAVEPGKSFTWATSGGGASMVATHTVTPRNGGSTLTLIVDSTGLAAKLFGWMLAGTGRRFMEMEAAGVKRRAEASPG